MTNSQLLSVCCRAFGIYLAFSTLPLFFAFFSSLNVFTANGSAADPYSYSGWMFYLASPVLLLVLASVLFFAPEKFARSLLSEDPDEDRKSDWLLFGAGGLSNLVSRWRKARFHPLASDADNDPATQT